MRQILLFVLLAFTVAAAGADDELLRRARSGDVTSQLQAADEFMFGKNGRRANSQLAVYWFRQAALQNSGTGQFNLAMCYQRGWGGKVRRAAAFHYFRKAMDNGVMRAAAQYAIMLYHGVPAESDPEGEFPEVKADPQAALEILRRVASHDRDGELFLAKYLFQNVENNAPELLKLLQHHAGRQNADPEMLILYAAFLRSGAGGVMDPHLAAQVLERAAKMRHPEAMAQFAELLHGGFGVKTDHARADKLIDEAIKLRSPRALVWRGNEYLNGWFREQDPHRAFELFTQAAEQKYPPALRQLGLCYASGAGVERDEKKALHYFLQAAGMGDGAGQFQVAECFRHGRGCEKDFQAAYYWYARAAENGEVSAMRETGLALLDGRGVTKDPVQGLKWLHRAAVCGDPAAQEALRVNDAASF